MCASSDLGQHRSELRMMSGIHAPSTNHSNIEDLSMSILVRTRKVMNYICEGQSQGKL